MFIEINLGDSNNQRLLFLGLWPTLVQLYFFNQHHLGGLRWSSGRMEGFLLKQNRICNKHAFKRPLLYILVNCVLNVHYSKCFQQCSNPEKFT